MKSLPLIIRLSLLVLVTVTPWLFGGVWARVQWVLMLSLAVLLAVDLIARFDDKKRPNLLPAAWLPLMAGIALGVFQLIPLSPSLANWLAPGSLQWRTEFLAAPGDSTHSNELGDRAAQSGTAIGAAARTLYTVATREYLALLCLGTAVFVLTSLYLVDKKSILWFFTAATLCGAALTFFGVVQRLSWNGKFYWVFEPLYGGFESFGPFVNRNNAGGFLNLCLAAGIGLLIWTHRNRLDLSAEEQRSERRRKHRRSQHGGRTSQSRSSHHLEEASQSPETPLADEAADVDGSTKMPTDEADDTAADAGTTPEETASGTNDPAHSGRSEQRQSDRRGGHPRRSQSRRSRRSSSRSGHSRPKYGSSYSVHPRPTFGESAEAYQLRIGEYFGNLNALRLWSIVLVGIIIGGVLCTASRGSILAMFVASMATCAALVFRSGNRGFAAGLVVMMLAGAGLMSWAGQTEHVRGRLASTLDESNYDTGRIPNWLEALNTVPQFWSAGTGLGTYRYVYERFQYRYLRDLAHFHAENQFVQAVVEGGIIALLLLFAAILLTGAATLRLYRSGRAIDTALAAAGTFALTSQIVGGSFDFGLYIPANMQLMAALCGIVIGRAAFLTVWPSQILDASQRSAGHPLSDHETTRSRHRTTRDETLSLVSIPAPASVVSMIVGILLLGCLFGSIELNRAAKIEVAMRATQLRDIREIDDPDSVASLIGPLQATLPNRWDDALAHRRLAELLMHQYQTETYARLLAEKKAQSASTDTDSEGADDDPRRDEDLWRRASVWHFNSTLRELDQQGDTTSIDSLVNQQSVQNRLRPALRHVLLARQSAPTIPQLHYMLAELLVVNDVRLDDQIHLQRARTLSPGDATMWYWTGLIDLNAGRNEQACQSWRQSLLLSPDHLSDIMDSARGKLTIRQILNDVIPMHAEMLLDTANEYFAEDAKASIRNKFLKRAEEALSQTDLPEDRMAYVTARIYQLRGRSEEAIPFYQTATSLNASNISWRYDYACLLRDLEKYDEALEQAVYLTSQRPTSGLYRRLYKEISSLRHRSASSK